MNKHKIIALVLTVSCLCVSVYVWASVLRGKTLDAFIPGPVNALVDKLMASTSEVPELAVQEVRIDDLGSHFSKSAETEVLAANLIVQSNTEVDAVAEEVIEGGNDVQEFVEYVEEVAAEVVEAQNEELFSAANELEDWEMHRAWNISIPDLGVRSPVFMPSMRYWSGQKWDLLEEQMQIGLLHGTVAYPHSAFPGENGSLIIAGHSSPPTKDAEQSAYGDVFARLPEITIGQRISILDGSNPVQYEVQEKMVVSPSQTSILAQQEGESVLKLITCFPVGTTRDRLIVIAKKVEDQ